MDSKKLESVMKFLSSKGVVVTNVQFNDTDIKANKDSLKPYDKINSSSPQIDSIEENSNDQVSNKNTLEKSLSSSNTSDDSNVFSDLNANKILDKDILKRSKTESKAVMKFLSSKGIAVTNVEVHSTDIKLNECSLKTQDQINFSSKYESVEENSNDTSGAETDLEESLSSSKISDNGDFFADLNSSKNLHKGTLKRKESESKADALSKHKKVKGMDSLESSVDNSKEEDNLKSETTIEEKVSKQDQIVDDIGELKEQLKVLNDTILVKPNIDNKNKYNDLMSEGNLPESYMKRRNIKRNLKVAILRASVESLTDTDIQYKPSDILDKTLSCKFTPCLYQDKNYNMMNRHLAFHFSDEILEKHEISEEELRCTVCGFEALSKEYIVLHLAFDHSALRVQLEEKEILIDWPLDKNNKDIKIRSNDEQDQVTQLDVEIFRKLIEKPPFQTFHEVKCPLDECKSHFTATKQLFDHLTYHPQMREKIHETFPWLISKKGCDVCHKVMRFGDRFIHAYKFHKLFEVLVGGSLIMKTIFTIQSALPKQVVAKHEQFMELSLRSPLALVQPTTENSLTNSSLNWKYACPIPDCWKIGIRQTAADFLSHLTSDHFRDSLLELMVTSNELKERKCRFCSIIIGDIHEILLHHVRFHDGLAEIIGHTELKNLMNSAVILNNKPMK